MEKVKKYEKKAIVQYEDIRDTIAVIEAMKLQGTKSGISWTIFQRKLHAKHN